MSHHIIAYDLQEISTLHGSVFNKTKPNIYKYLNCENLDGHVSGTGESKIFTIKEIKEALDHSKESSPIDFQSIRFLKEILEERDYTDEDMVVIYFG